MDDRKSYELISVVLVFLMWVMLGSLAIVSLFVGVRAGEGVDVKLLTLLLVAIPTLIGILRGSGRLWQAIIVLWMVLSVTGLVGFVGGIILQIGTVADLGIATAVIAILTSRLLTIGGESN